MATAKVRCGKHPPWQTPALADIFTSKRLLRRTNLPANITLSFQVKHHTVKTSRPGPNGEQYCWWQCTVKGGREGRDIDAVALAKAVEALGAGEILLNCIDNDGAGKVGGGCAGESKGM